MDPKRLRDLGTRGEEGGGGGEEEGGEGGEERGRRGEEEEGGGGWGVRRRRGRVLLRLVYGELFRGVEGFNGLGVEGVGLQV